MDFTSSLVLIFSAAQGEGNLEDGSDFLFHVNTPQKVREAANAAAQVGRGQSTLQSHSNVQVSSGGHY